MLGDEDQRFARIVDIFTDATIYTKNSKWGNGVCGWVVRATDGMLIFDKKIQRHRKCEAGEELAQGIEHFQDMGINHAELRAITRGLQAAVGFTRYSARVFTDSNNAYCWINKKWNINDPKIREEVIEIERNKLLLDRVEIKWIEGSHNLAHPLVSKERKKYVLLNIDAGIIRTPAQKHQSIKTR